MNIYIFATIVVIQKACSFKLCKLNKIKDKTFTTKISLYSFAWQVSGKVVSNKGYLQCLNHLMADSVFKFTKLGYVYMVKLYYI